MRRWYSSVEWGLIIISKEYRTLWRYEYEKYKHVHDKNQAIDIIL